MLTWAISLWVLVSVAQFHFEWFNGSQLLTPFTKYINVTHKYQSTGREELICTYNQIGDDSYYLWDNF